MPDTQFAETFKKGEDISGNRFVQPPHVGKISAAILSGVVPSEKEIGDSFPFHPNEQKAKSLAG